MDVPLKLIRAENGEIVFESRTNRNWIFVGLGGLMATVALAGHGPGRLGARLGVFAVGAVLTSAGICAALWREHLVLNLPNRQWRRARGYVWHISTQTGSFDEIEAVTLSTEIRGGGRGGTYTVLVVGLRFREPLAAAIIEGFRTEGDARELIVLLTRALHVPFIDRTVEPTRQVEWNDVGRSRVDQTSKEHRGNISSPGAIPTPPPMSGIELAHAGDHPIITLPPAGFRADALLVIAFTSAFLWIGYQTLRGMVGAVLAGTEHYWLGWVIGSLLFLIGLSGVLHGIALMLAREYVRDEGDALVLGKRIWRMAFGKAAVAKDGVIDIAMSPAQSAEGDSALVQRAMREMVPSIGNWQVSVAILQKEGRRNLGATLRSNEQQWLVDALRAMCESRA
jgi:hypothetical protein